jgi:hypothetical protein
MVDEAGGNALRAGRRNGGIGGDAGEDQFTDWNPRGKARPGRRSQTGAGRECGIRAHRSDSRCGHAAAAGHEHRPTGRAFDRPPFAGPPGATTMGGPM